MSANLQSPIFSVNVPIGTVLPWDDSIVGVPALPQGWILRDGSTITDARSPMNGQTPTSLNGNSESTKRFIRGSTTSGSTGGSPTINANVTVSGGGSTYGISGNISVINPYYEIKFIMRIF